MNKCQNDESYVYMYVYFRVLLRLYSRLIADGATITHWLMDCLLRPRVWHYGRHNLDFTGARSDHSLTGG